MLACCLRFRHEEYLAVATHRSDSCDPVRMHREFRRVRALLPVHRYGQPQVDPMNGPVGYVKVSDAVEYAFTADPLAIRATRVASATIVRIGGRPSDRGRSVESAT